jgi:hypothetical protein
MAQSTLGEKIKGNTVGLANGFSEMGGQEDDSDLAEIQFACRRGSIELPLETVVHEHDIGSMILGELQSLLAGTCNAHNRVAQGGQGYLKIQRGDCLVFNNENSL